MFKYIFSRALGVTMLANRPVLHTPLDRNISATIRWIAVKLGSDTHVHHRVTFTDPLTSHSARVHKTNDILEEFHICAFPCVL